MITGAGSVGILDARGTTLVLSDTDTTDVHHQSQL